MEARRLLQRHRGRSVAEIIQITARPKPSRMKLLKRQIKKLVMRLEGTE